MTIQLHCVRLRFGNIAEQKKTASLIEATNLLNEVIQPMGGTKFWVCGHDLATNEFEWEIRALINSPLKLETKSLRGHVNFRAAKPICHLRLKFGAAREDWLLLREAVTRLEQIGVAAPICETGDRAAPIWNLIAREKTPLMRIEAVG